MNLEKTIKQWYLPLISGSILILAGVLTLLYPVESYKALSVVFSISFLLVGIIEGVFAVRNRNILTNWGWPLIFGTLTALIGLVLIFNPQLSMQTLPYYVGFMFLIRSLGAIGVSVDLKNYGFIEWGTLMIIGIFGLLFSMMLIWDPKFAGLNIIFWTSMILFFSGGFSIFASFKLRKLYLAYETVNESVINAFRKTKKQIMVEIEKQLAEENV